MGLADIASVPLDDNQLSKWAFLHAAAHSDINRVIFQRSGVNLQSYVLDPIDPNNTGAWEYQHQLMHNNQNAILGIAGQDLLGVNWKDEKVLRAWLFLHFPEHQQASAILGV